MKMTLPATTLQRAVRAVACAYSRDNGHRRSLTGIRLQWDKTGALSATATDTYRLHVATVPCPWMGADRGIAEWTALVPGDWLARWAREAWWDTTGGRRKTSLITTLTLASGRIKLATGDDERARPLIRDQFPTLQQILDQTRERGITEGEVGFNPKLFADLVKSAHQFSPYQAMRVQAWDPHKANRFLVDAGPERGRLEMLLMPVRLAPASRASGVAA